MATFALAGASALLAVPTAASAARSGVTIRLFVGDSLKGFVFSPKPRKCADARTVKLFRQTGREQNPKRDINVAKTRAARRSNGKYRWELALHRPHPGNYYARVPATAACEADNSKTIRTSARPRTRLNAHVFFSTRSALFEYSAVGGIEPYKFRCKLDDQRYRRCRGNEKNYRHLSRGHHVFKVFAVGANGKRDRTPAKRGFHFPR